MKSRLVKIGLVVVTAVGLGALLVPAVFSRMPVDH